LVGISLASRISIGIATQTKGWELQAMASSVIGGRSLLGAIGSVHGPLLGFFILTTINNGANLINVNAFWQRVITGYSSSLSSILTDYAVRSASLELSPWL
jgi:ribose transport system permease protein